MKPIEFYQRLTGVDRSMQVSFYQDDGTPTKLEFNINEHDAMAAQLLLWLDFHMPDDTTIGDVLDILDAARWWVTFWSSLYDSHKVFRASTDHEVTDEERFYAIATPAYNEGRLPGPRLGELIRTGGQGSWELALDLLKKDLGIQEK